MKSTLRVTSIVLWSSLIFVGLAAAPGAAQTETQKQTEERMVREAKEAADRVEKSEKEGKGETNYDVKKTHDEHIKVTEKAAGEAAERK